MPKKTKLVKFYNSFLYFERIINSSTVKIVFTLGVLLECQVIDDPEILQTEAVVKVSRRLSSE